MLQEPPWCSKTAVQKLTIIELAPSDHYHYPSDHYVAGEMLAASIKPKQIHPGFRVQE